MAAWCAKGRRRGAHLGASAGALAATARAWEQLLSLGQLMASTTCLA
jgi:aryl carrier-like protein